MAAARQKEMKESMTEVATITFACRTPFAPVKASALLIKTSRAARAPKNERGAEATRVLPRPLMFMEQRRCPSPLAYEVSGRAWAEKSPTLGPVCGLWGIRPVPRREAERRF